MYMIDWWLVFGAFVGSVCWNYQESKRKQLEDKIDMIQNKLDDIENKTNIALDLCKKQTSFFTIK